GGRDRDRLQLARADPVRDSARQCRLLRADAERIGGVLDVDALEDAPVARERRRADEKAGVRRICARCDRDRPLVELPVGHEKTWKMTRVVSAPRMPP